MAYKFANLLVENLGNFVYHVKLNRPQKRNALSWELLLEIGSAFDQIRDDPDCRAVVVSGEGKVFSSGLDLKGSPLGDAISANEGEDIARKGRSLRKMIFKMQDCLTAIERLMVWDASGNDKMAQCTPQALLKRGQPIWQRACRNLSKCEKPVIAAMHGVCLGAAIEVVAACDVRYASSETQFSIKEIDAGLAADLGALNRLPKICGNESWMKEMTYSARPFGAEEALKFDLLSRIFPTPEGTLSEAMKLAQEIASKSPVAVQGTKLILNYSRDHTVAEGLDYVATWNQSQLFTEDIPASGAALVMRQPMPPFAKL